MALLFGGVEIFVPFVVGIKGNNPVKYFFNLGQCFRRWCS